MSPLEDLILVLDTAESNRFVQFLRSGGRSSDRMDERLFLLLADESALNRPEDIALTLYGKPNVNAYHTLRKRLLRKLYVFLYGRMIETGEDEQAEVALMVKAATLLIERDKTEPARKLLHQAGKKARQSENYEGGLVLLRFEIEHCDVLGLDYMRLLDQWKELHHLTSIKQRVDIAYSVLRMKLREVRVTGQLSSLDALVRKELDTLGIDLNQDLPVAVVYKMMDIIRIAIIATKQYHQFEPLITQTYQHLTATGRITPNDTRHQIAFCYMIAHTKFRTRKMDEAMVWTERLKMLFSQSKTKQVRSYVARYYLLKASIHNFNGQNERAIDVLEYALSRPELVTAERLNVLINLAVFHFQVSDFKKAHQTLSSIDIGERQCGQIMGREWLFKKGLIEMIILIELNYPELILTRLRTVKRLYREFLNDPNNGWMELFLNAIQLMLSDPLSVNNKKLAARLDEMVKRWPVNREDLHAMTFRSWLTSKVTKRPYYEELLSALNAENNVSADQAIDLQSR